MNMKFLFLFVALLCIVQFTQARPDFVEDVKDVWKSSVKGVKNTFGSIGDWFSDKTDDAKDGASDILDSAKSGVKDITKKISRR